MRGPYEAAREFARDTLWGIFGVLWIFGGAVAFYVGARAARPGATADAARFEALRVPAAGAGLFVAAGAAFGLLPGEGQAPGGQPPAAASGLVFCGRPLYYLPLLPEVVPGSDSPGRSIRPGSSYFPINVGVALLGLFDWYVDFRRRGEGVIEKS